MTENDIAVLEARAAVHEILIVHMLREVFAQSGHDGPARLKSLMSRIEDVLARAERDATDQEAKAAHAAREVFRHISLKLIQSLPHQGHH